jgi:AbrB family looped-hinge helix DNA binding protein
MANNEISDVVLRPKRQVTIPKKLCEQLGIESGDILELVVKDSLLIAKPKKSLALEALKEIQQAFQRSGITEEELLKEGNGIRREVTRKPYVAKI